MEPHQYLRTRLRDREVAAIGEDLSGAVCDELGTGRARLADAGVQGLLTEDLYVSSASLISDANPS